ncbi:MAG TPA: hypothetical protein VL738_27225 [Dactylosporangium sp.]|jgi:hypothetical protein|nr:hypothetical protein [Dactylosporangium sp.]
MTVDAPPGDPLVVSAPRFLVEIVAWIAVPWAIGPHSVWLAVLADVVLIGLPTVFGMPGAKKQRTPVSVSAVPAIGLELLQAAAACAGAAVAWPPAAAVVVAVLAVVACALQLRRWRWMLAQ